jgi:hypothetical protein
MWLIMMGKRRSEISLIQAHESYRQRFDLEHTFRFKKQNLLLSDFETPDVEHEQDWVYLVMLAYVELWAAHFPGSAMSKPIHRLELVPQRYSRTGIELFPSWVHQPLHPKPEVNPLDDNRGKLRLPVLGFQW